MGKASIFPSATIALLAIPFFLASCATSDGDIFAHPAAPSAPPATSAGTSATGRTAASIRPQSILRSFVGVEADRLRREIGGTNEMQTTDHFVFVAPPQSADLPQIAHLLERTHGEFFDVFGGKDRLSPIRTPLVWMVFEGRTDYETYAQAADGMDMSWSKAYYSAQTNRVAIALANDGERALAPPATTTTSSGAAALPVSNNDKLFSQITHEAGHQLAFNSGLQTRGVMYPLWASEGLATNFEMDSKGNLGPTSHNALRTRHLSNAVADKRIVPLEQWVSYSRVPVGRPAQVNAVYSQSWAFFRFLYEHRREQLHDYLAHMARQQPGRRSEDALKKEFVKIFGDTQALSAPWNDYLAKLTEGAQD